MPIDPYPLPTSAVPEDSSSAEAPHGVVSPPRKLDAGNSSAGESEKQTEQGLSLSTRRRIMTAPRLIFVAAVAAIVFTGIWAYRQSVLSDAKRRYREHADAGYAALAKGEFLIARSHFEQAVEAADILERDDVDVRLTRQMFRETNAISSLCTESLHDILTEANAMLRKDAKSWKPHFDREYAGRWLIIDTHVSKNQTASGGNQLVLDYPLRVAGWPVELDGELEAIQPLRVGYAPQRVILAVQLESCYWQGGTKKRWHVGFNQESAFLWTGYDNLRAVGFAVASESEAGQPGEIDTADELKSVLSTQARIAGLKE